jgi:hypothetical protein
MGRNPDMKDDFMRGVTVARNKNLARCGPQSLRTGDKGSFRTGKYRELIISNLHGKFFEQSYRGKAFVGTQSAGAILSAVTGLGHAFGIYNPESSGVFLSIIRFEVVVTVRETGSVRPTLGLAEVSNANAGVSTGTAVPVIPGIVGSSSIPNAKVLGPITLPHSPVSLTHVARGLDDVVGTTIPNIPSFNYDPDGTLLMLPGTSVVVCVNELTANITALCSVIWEELPLDVPNPR